jgi:hypothetical protein
MQVRNESFKDTTICSTFWESGIWCIDQDVFQESDYTLSNSTSIHPMVSTGCPIQPVLPDHQLWLDVKQLDGSGNESDSEPRNERKGDIHSPASPIPSTDPASSVFSHTPSALRATTEVVMTPFPPSAAANPMYAYKCPVPRTVQSGCRLEAYMKDLEVEALALRRELKGVAMSAAIGFEDLCWTK